MKYWDPRFTRSVKTLSTSLQINSCDVHRYAPLLAWWVTPHGNHCCCDNHIVHSASRNQSIKIYSTDSDELVNSIRYHDGFMGQRIGPTRCLAFHPHKVIISASEFTIYKIIVERFFSFQAWLAAGGSDGLIAVYSLEKKR